MYDLIGALRDGILQSMEEKTMGDYVSSFGNAPTQAMDWGALLNPSWTVETLGETSGCHLRSA